MTSMLWLHSLGKVIDMTPITTCKDCTERVVGCHSKCEKYLEAKAKDDLKREGIYKELNGQKDLVDYKIRKAESGRRRKHRR